MLAIQDSRRPRIHLEYSVCPSSEPTPHIKQFLVLWPLFFLICFGLGHQTLNRADPRGVLYDTRAYYNLVSGVSNPEFSEYSHRVLVPYLAKPFYWIARGHVGTWDPVLFGLLISNSLFFATATWLLVDIGCIIIGDRVLALLGGMLYLLNFSAANYHLSAMVDSAQACVMIAIIRTLLTEKWRWLVLWGLIGAFTKETSAPIYVAFASGWWLASPSRHGLDWSKAFWIAAMATIGMVALILLMSYVSPYSPWSFAVSQGSTSADRYLYLASGLRCFFNHEFVYVFAWLLPLGLSRLKAFPRPWIVASLAGVVAAVAMGAYSDAGGNTARPMFNAAGPLLSLSAALAVSRLTGSRSSNWSDRFHS
jgi:hypothetical protein